LSLAAGSRFIAIVQMLTTTDAMGSSFNWSTPSGVLTVGDSPTGDASCLSKGASPLHFDWNISTTSPCLSSISWSASTFDASSTLDFLAVIPGQKVFEVPKPGNFSLSSDEGFSWIPALPSGTSLFVLANNPAVEDRGVRQVNITDGDTSCLTGSTPFASGAAETNGSEPVSTSKPKQALGGIIAGPITFVIALCLFVAFLVWRHHKKKRAQATGLGVSDTEAQKDPPHLFTTEPYVVTVPSHSAATLLPPIPRAVYPEDMQLDDVGLRTFVPMAGPVPISKRATLSEPSTASPPASSSTLPEDPPVDLPAPLPVPEEPVLEEENGSELSAPPPAYSTVERWDRAAGRANVGRPLNATPARVPVNGDGITEEPESSAGNSTRRTEKRRARAPT